jgi:comEA protein
MIRWLICLTLGYLTGPTTFASWQEVLKALPTVSMATMQEAPAPQEPAPAPVPAPTKKPASSTLVNINTATVQELDGLPGIGLHMAQRIVDYRQKNGPFKRLEDLMSVQGIGEKNFLKLKPLITIASPKSDRGGTSQR